MRRSILLAAAFALAACTADDDTQPGGNESAIEPGNVANGMGAPSVQGSAAPAMPIPSDSASQPAGSQPDDPAQCGADEYQWLVGQPRSLIPETPEGAKWRVACTSCPVTMDYSPARMNIFYDEETEIIEEVKCG